MWDDTDLDNRVKVHTTTVVPTHGDGVGVVIVVVCVVHCALGSFGSVGAFSLHKLHGLLLDRLDALGGAVLLLVLQVALEEELDLLHREAQVDHAVKQRPGGDSGGLQNWELDPRSA